MPDCLPPGWIRDNGPCALFEEVNDHGLVLFECGDVAYIPADCPDALDEGGLSLGAAFAKFASVDGSVNRVVQRDSTGQARAQSVQLEAGIGLCDPTRNTSRLNPQDVSVGSVRTIFFAGPVPVATLRLRGNADFPVNGGAGLIPDSEVGIFEIVRWNGAGGADLGNGMVEYINYGSPLVSIGNHEFKNVDYALGMTQRLMDLAPGGGTLYFPAWTYVSDERLKDDISVLDGQTALGVVLGISPIAYAMHGRRYHGFSAQDVQHVLPDAVNEPKTKDQPYTLRTDDIVANLVAAVKYLAARVEALEKAAGVS